MPKYFISQDGGITVRPQIVGGTLEAWATSSEITPIRTTNSGSVFVTGSMTAELSAGDIQIGAVEIKNATTDARAIVDSSGFIYVSASIQSKPTPDSAYAFNSYNSTAFESCSVVSTRASTLYGFTGYNSGSTDQFVLLFNSGSEAPNAAVPVFPIRAAAESNFGWDAGPYGIPMTSGIILANSTTPDRLTSGSNDIWLSVVYK